MNEMPEWCGYVMFFLGITLGMIGVEIYHQNIRLDYERGYAAGYKEVRKHIDEINCLESTIMGCGYFLSYRLAADNSLTVEIK